MSLEELVPDRPVVAARIPQIRSPTKFRGEYKRYSRETTKSAEKTGMEIGPPIPSCWLPFWDDARLLWKHQEKLGLFSHWSMKLEKSRYSKKYVSEIASFWKYFGNCVILKIHSLDKSIVTVCCKFSFVIGTLMNRGNFLLEERKMPGKIVFF